MERFFANIMRHGGKTTALIELGRPWNGAMSGLLAVMGIVITGSLVTPLGYVLIFLLFTIAYMAGSTLNDIYDEFVDRLNMPFRPLQENRIKRGNAWLFSLVMHTLALIIGLILGFRVFVLIIVFFIFSVFYSVPPVQFSRRGILSQIELCFTVIFLPLYAGIVYSMNSFIPGLNVLIFSIFFFCFSIPISLLKDFKDIKGDKIGNKKTTIIQIGIRNTQILSVTGILAFFLLTIFYLSLLVQLSAAFLMMFSILAFLLVLTGIKITRHPEALFGGARILMLIFVLLIIFSFL